MGSEDGIQDFMLTPMLNMMDRSPGPEFNILKFCSTNLKASLFKMNIYK